MPADYGEPVPPSPPALLLGEWACLGILCQAPSHGFAVASRLRPSGDIGRVWTMSRPLTYRALDQLVAKGCAMEAGSEPGIAGGNRTILRPTRTGRARMRAWLVTPVDHLRDVRSELLLKLVLADLLGADATTLVDRQRQRADELAAALADPEPTDVVALWRHESARAVVRFLDRLR